MLLTLLLLACTSVFAQEDQSQQALGVCVMYKLTFPSGHAEAEHHANLWNQLPSDLEEKVREHGLPNLSTSDFIEVYEAQQDFCEEHEAEVAHFVLELQSGDEMTAESEEFLDVLVFESAAALSQSVATTERRRLFLLTVAVGIFVGVVGLALLGFLGLAIYALFIRRRALTALNTIEVPTMELISACSNNIGSFVCGLSTLALTEVITSEFCGGDNLESCNVDFQYALDYVSALATGN